MNVNPKQPRPNANPLNEYCFEVFRDLTTRKETEGNTKKVKQGMLKGSCAKANAKPNKKNLKKTDFESVVILAITN